MTWQPTPGSAADLSEDADPEQVARTIALRRLESAPRTRAELAKTLAQRGVPDAAADVVLDRFEEVGLIDDAAFAHAWVTTRHAGRGLGRRALSEELRRKGIAPDLIESACATLDDEDERVRARQLADRKVASMRGLDHRKAMSRLAGMLARRGYSASLAYEVAREALSDAETDSSSTEIGFTT